LPGFESTGSVSSWTWRWPQFRTQAAARLDKPYLWFYGLAMKTTVEVPDQLYRQIKARAALKGQTIKSFFLDAIRDKLLSDNGKKRQTKKKEEVEIGWRTAYGAADPNDVAEVQRMIDEEFSRIDPEDWK
jgi:hypothetical protein